MGNIMSFFFPKPAPGSIEQVEKDKQEGDATEEAVEGTVAAVAQDANISKQTSKTVEFVKMIYFREVVPEEQNDKDFEVVEEIIL